MKVEAGQGTVDEAVVNLAVAVCVNAAFNTEVGEMKSK
jgi:large-conductance mechanosensitive channel